METLLDPHSTVIDTWLRGQLSPWHSPLLSYFLTGVTLLDQLVLENSYWRTLPVIIQGAGASGSFLRFFNTLPWLVDLLDRKESQNAFPRVFSRFLMDRARAGQSLWVSPRMYVNLAKKILKILGNE